MTEKLDRIQISVVPDGIPNLNNPEPIEFHINPNSCNVSRRHFEGFQKTRASFAKVYVGLGEYVLNFSGMMSLNPYFESRGFEGSAVGGDPKAVDDIRSSEAYKWMQRFIAYVNKYAPYLFRLQYFGVPLDLSELKDPVFIGTISTPSIVRSAEQPMLLSYSFTFNGIIEPVSKQIETGQGTSPKTLIKV